MDKQEKEDVLLKLIISINQSGRVYAENVVDKAKKQLDDYERACDRL